MSKLLTTWLVMCRFKYIIVISTCVIILGFVGDNSVWNRTKRAQEIHELKAEIREYKESYRRDFEKLRLLETSPQTIQRVARERYFMKTADEDIYVIENSSEE